MKIKTIIILLLQIIIMDMVSAKQIINVFDQSSFDMLQENLRKAIKSGDNEINVILSRGTFIAKVNHIYIQNINNPHLKISFLGNDAIIVPIGNVYRNGDKYLGESPENSSWMNGSNDVKTWSDVHYADGIVEILDETKKLCRLKSKDPFLSFAKGSTHILIPHWYQSSVYRIDKITDNYIYFFASDLKVSYNKGYNVNDDFNFGKKLIRFKLLNAKGNKDCVRVLEGKVYLPTGVSMVREGVANQFIVIQNCLLNSLLLSGINFYGNSFVHYGSAIVFNKINCDDLYVHNCEFRGMRSNVLTITSCSNVRIENNSFTDCYYYGIQSDNNSKHTTIKGNTFTSFGKRMHNTFCIVCRGENYLISENKLTNYGYGGIAVGVWYKQEKKHLSSGIVENNELYFSDDYINNIDQYGIMDSGAIYLCTKNDQVVIRNNYIHNYSGAYGNRGIFCDDGAYNYQIYGNIITNIANSYCIASRREPNVEITKTPESGIVKSNVNNVIRDNIVDGEILFVGHEDIKNGCVKGANYILMKKGEKAPKNTIKNIINPEEDIPLEFVGLANGKHYITSQSYRKLKKSKSWKNLRKLVGKY